MRIGFLGPRGTFTEEALLASVSVDEQGLVPYPTEADVLHAVERGEVEKGIVPIENSIEGSVNATLDVLAFETDLSVEKEIVIPIVHNLIGRRGLALADVARVVSHPQATAQCRLYLAKKLAGVPVIAASSTAEAVKQVAEENGSSVAIGPGLAAELYDLSIIDPDIADFEENKTRFVIVGKETPPASGKDKTSIVCFIKEDHPGALLQILNEFAYENINLTKIQSRPTRKALGDYCFFIDIEGHITDRSVETALKFLRYRIREVKVLGSYPRANHADA
ncbi:MAG: prephenate dehydratase [Actinobacteria bacterium]|nr:prephenate dehydratase [Actinomycetota bacterium]